MPKPELDDLDRRILTGLQIDPRVTWGKLAEVLGESDRTVARRAQRMFAADIVRITAISDDGTHGGTAPVHLRAEVTPGAADCVATTLAERPDARTVLATTGEQVLWTELVVADRAELHTVLAKQLPRIPGITRLQSHVVLRAFSLTSQWHAPGLTPEQVAALSGRGHRDAPPAPPAPSSRASPTVPRDPVDRRIADVLRRDGRAAVGRIAEELGISLPTASRRLAALLADGRLKLRAQVAPAWLGLPVEAQLRLAVDPGVVERCGTYLAAQPEVSYCAAVSDSYALLLDIAVASEADVYRFVSRVAEHVPGVFRSEVSLITRTYKRGGLPRDGLRTLEAP